MRKVFIALLLSAVVAAPLSAQESRDQAIQSLINDQIAALQADDFTTAFSFASPTIQGLFGNSENFGAMVRQGYPMVYRPKSVRMLGVREDGGLVWQRVMVTDRAGATHLLDYQLVKTPEGWLINAVQLLPQSGVAA
ncbi:DUF4864 domain-containing protein [Pseudorhodobacter wandonensis]|uniref:DUF4864 domain-containing protein n=1 Tax=Pseudorhodobacter wandonensis TaxID=1120568 RepID=UPI00067E1BDE|nr:DUF4864 domain-containing protein [Pseudorhodobacter wandonensis]